MWYAGKKKTSFGLKHDKNSLLEWGVVGNTNPFWLKFEVK